MCAAKFCPNCGAAMLSDSSHGICPRCAFRVALDSPSKAGAAPTISGEARHGMPFQAPKPEQLAPYFPQLEILDLIGQGGMGAVYKARQKGLDRFVALKILPPQSADDPAFAERFHREARALAKLNHPHIVSVYDSGQAGDVYYYFLMEYVDGVNVRQAIQSGTIEPKAALAIVPQICDALQYAHDEGIVHRDIKPENILLDRRGRVKIADFGLARLLGKTADTLTLTGTHQVMGTPKYMAPEQLEGSHEVDHRADIYSLGVVFYEMLTRELPLGRFAPPSRKVQVDVRLDEVVLRTLEKEPHLRYQQAGDVKTAVEDITGALRIPPQMLRMYGYEYRSKQEIFGIPWLHIAYGLDPKTHRRRIARGIIAVGDIAIGVLALGGMSFGVICLGGLAMGLVTLGGASVGLLLAFGGAAVGLGISLGGFAVGTVAVGGCAVGVYAMGGAALGLHAVGGNANDPVARDFFRSAWPIFLRVILIFSAVFPVVMLLGSLIGYFQRRSQARRAEDGAATWQPPMQSGKQPLVPGPDDVQQNHRTKHGSAFATGCAVLSVMLLLCGVPLIGMSALGFVYLRVDRSRAVAIEQEHRARMAAEMAAQRQQIVAKRAVDGYLKSGIRWTSDGPELSPLVVQALNQTGQTPIAVEPLNETIQAVFQEYLQHERGNHHREDRGSSSEITVHIPQENIDSLEHDLWGKLDSMIDTERQIVLRSVLRPIPPARTTLKPGATMAEMVTPSILGWGSHETKIRIRRMGTWYEWTINSQGAEVGGSGPQLPSELQRFAEPSSPEAEAEPQPDPPATDGQQER